MKSVNEETDASRMVEKKKQQEAKFTSQMLAMAREQEKEIEKEDQESLFHNESHMNGMKNDQSLFMNDMDEETEETEENESKEAMENDIEANDIIRYNNGFIEEAYLHEEEEEVLDTFMGNGRDETRNLADLIMAKIEEKERKEEMARNAKDNDDSSDLAPALHPKIIEVYREIGALLSHYTSGKLPRAFKIISSLSNWEDIVWLTTPTKWTPHAMYAATKLFASNLNPMMAQRFYSIFLLDAIREDIHTNQKLNYHLYMALKKAIYKPQAFFKGIILPLADPHSQCTLREALIIGSVLTKVSIPLIHSAAAIMKLTEIKRYDGPHLIFLKMLLDKKYSLPVRVIKSVTTYFVRYLNYDQRLPLLWHQALLVFVQRYKDSIQQKEAKEQKEKLKAVLKKHFHEFITPEIRRELFYTATTATTTTTSM